MHGTWKLVMAHRALCPPVTSSHSAKDSNWDKSYSDFWNFHWSKWLVTCLRLVTWCLVSVGTHTASSSGSESGRNTSTSPGESSSCEQASPCAFGMSLSLCQFPGIVGGTSAITKWHSWKQNIPSILLLVWNESCVINPTYICARVLGSSHSWTNFIMLPVHLQLQEYFITVINDWLTSGFAT